MNNYYLTIVISIPIILLFTNKNIFISLLLFITNPIYKYTSCIGNKPFYKDSYLESSQILIKKWKVFRDEAIHTFMGLLLFITNPVYEYTSCIGNKPFYKDSDFESSQFLTKNWKVFRDEALSTYKSYNSIKGDLYFNDDVIRNKSEWKKLYIKWYSDIDPIARQKCPKSCQLIESLPDVKIAMFSVLLPGACIKPHVGPHKGCVRYLLGLVTPNSDNCYIVVNNIKYSWKDGEGVIIDDTYRHWIRNNTNIVRIVLFCDIVRPMTPFGKNLNNFVMNNFGYLTSRNN